MDDPRSQSPPLPTRPDCGTVPSCGVAAMVMKDDPELFATDPAPKRRPRAKRAAAPDPEPEAAPAIVSEAVATLDDLRVAGERFIREQPLLAVSLAVGLGYLIGRLRR